MASSSSSSNSETPTKTVWKRSGKVDKSKRVAHGAKIEKKNIVTGTRRRKNVNYKDIELGKKVRTVKRASKNTVEKRKETPRVKSENKKRGRKTNSKEE